jgi:hypothetical protein
MADKYCKGFLNGFRNGFWATFVLSLLFLPTIYSAEVAPEGVPFELVSNLNSPAATILDITPEVISRPYTFRELSTSIITATDSFRIIPKGFELEFAPYWIFAGEKIRYKDYVGNKIEQNILQSASISFATPPDVIYTVAPPDLPPSSVAFGARFSLLRGNLTSDCEMAIDKIEVLIDGYTSQFHEYALALVADDPVLKDPNASDKEKERALDRIREKVVAKIYSENPSLCDSIDILTSNLHLQRTGLKVDVAGAIALNYPQEGGLSDFELAKASGWFTVGYEDHVWSGVGLLRYMVDSIDPDQTGLDIGIKGISDNPEQRLSWSTEGVLRWLTDAESLLLKLSATLNYKLQRNVLISVTFGHELGPDSGNPFVAANLSLSFGGKRLPLDLDVWPKQIK